MSRDGREVAQPGGGTRVDEGDSSGSERLKAAPLVPPRSITCGLCGAAVRIVPASWDVQLEVVQEWMAAHGATEHDGLTDLPAATLAALAILFAYAARGEYQLALDDLDRALQSEPDFLPAEIVRLKQFGDPSDFDRAVLRYGHDIMLKPDYALLERTRGFALFMLGRTADATEVLSGTVARCKASRRSSPFSATCSRTS